MTNNKRLGTALAAGAVAMGLLLSASAAPAATVNVDPTDENNAIGITGLEFGGQVFNVEFVFVRTDNFYPPYDFTAVNVAVDASRAINQALNDYNAEPSPDIRTVGPPGGGEPNHRIGFERQGDSYSTILSELDISVDPDEWVVEALDTVGASVTATYADFTVVPVPAAVWLLGSGLVAVGAAARRRRMTA